MPGMVGRAIWCAPSGPSLRWQTPTRPMPISTSCGGHPERKPTGAASRSAHRSQSRSLIVQDIRHATLGQVSSTLCLRPWHPSNSTETPMSAELEGGCLCGSVRFRATEPPLRTIACHCTFCQRLTGSSFYAESLFSLDAVKFNDGALHQYRHVSDGSGQDVVVHFCPTCGTTVGLTFGRWPDLRAISRGCYDEPNAVELVASIWTRSAQTGVALPSGIDCFAKARATLDGQPETAKRFDVPVMARESIEP